MILQNKEKSENACAKNEIANSLNYGILDFDSKRLWTTDGHMVMCKPLSYGPLDNQGLTGTRLIEPQLLAISKDEDLIIHHDKIQVPSVAAEFEYKKILNDKNEELKHVNVASVCDPFKNRKPIIKLNFNAKLLKTLLTSLGHGNITMHLFENDGLKSDNQLILENQVIITSYEQEDVDATGLIMQKTSSDKMDPPLYFENRIKNNIQCAIDFEVEEADNKERAIDTLKKLKDDLAYVCSGTNIEISLPENPE